MKLRRLWWVGLVALAIAIPAAVAGAVEDTTTTTAATGIDVNFEGNGLPCTPGQFDDLNPGPGEEAYLFILTSPAGSTSDLTVETDQGTFGPIAGTQEGGGSIHFAVNLPADATITGATATGGTEQSNLVVSHCELGEEETTTTTTQPTPTTSAVPEAVTVQPKFTG